MYRANYVHNYNRHMRNQVLVRKGSRGKTASQSGFKTNSYYSEFHYPDYTRSG